MANVKCPACQRLMPQATCPTCFAVRSRRVAGRQNQMGANAFNSR